VSVPAITKPLLAVAGLLATAVLIAVIATGGEHRHELVVASKQARFMVPGLEVRIAGQPVGAVESAEPTRQGTAIVKLSIDDTAWPLPTGTRAFYRWAGTIGFTNRYVELVALRRGTGTLAEGATITGRDVTEAVEVDDVARLFDDAGRVALRATIDRSGVVLQRAASELPAALDRAPRATEQAHALVQDLGADPAALAALVRSTDRLVHAVRVSSPDVGRLVDGMRGTFAATASRASALQRTLSEAPATLDATRTTLRRAEATLERADRMLVRLAPGIGQLRRAAGPLNSVLRRLLNVAPDARLTLAALREAAPDLRQLLDRATTVAPKLTRASEQVKPQLACIRPYAPEVAGFVGTWNGFISRGDGTDKYARANAAFYPFQEGTGLTSGDVARTFPQLHYAFPRPPGEIANQPWFLPECNLGPDTVDPTKDPEINR